MMAKAIGETTLGRLTALKAVCHRRHISTPPPVELYRHVSDTAPASNPRKSLPSDTAHIR